MTSPLGRGHVIVVSDRCAAGESEDLTGPVIARGLGDLGLAVDAPQVIPDGEQSVSAAIAQALDAGARVVITTGGTGVGPRDLSPEGTAAHLSTLLPGIPEQLRSLGARHSPHALLSRGLAGLSPSGALIVNLPGSPTAVAEGMELLRGLIPYLLDVRAGGGHP